MSVFRIMFPDFIVQEVSRIVKFLCVTAFEEEKDVNWKDFILGQFKEAQSVFVSTAAEVLATDYRLSKHALMQPFMACTTVVVEMSTPKHGMEAFLQLNDAIFQKTGVYQSF